MKGRVGTATRICSRIPHARELAKVPDLSRSAARRLKWMDHYARCRNARLTCRYFGISPTTFYKWRDRYKKMGPKGLEERSRRPKRARPSSIPQDTIETIVALRKRYPAWSKYKLSVIARRDRGVFLSPSSVGRILKAKGLICERRANNLRKAHLRRAKRQKAERYLKDLFPGSLVYLDTKHRYVAGARRYQFTAVDAKTRIGFIRLYGGASSAVGRKFLAELSQYLPFEIGNVQTDNGAEFLGHFHAFLEAAEIRHYFSDPNCPKQNARVERAIKTTVEELWAYRDAVELEELNRIADEWNHTYNFVRPHQALSYQTPVEYFMKLSETDTIKPQVSTM